MRATLPGCWEYVLCHGDSVSRCPNCREGQSTFAHTFDSVTCPLCEQGLDAAVLMMSREGFIECRIKELRATIDAYCALLRLNSPTRSMLLPAMSGLVESVAALEAMPLEKFPPPPSDDDAVQIILE